MGAVGPEVLFAGGASVRPGHDVVEFGVDGCAAAAGESAVDVAGADVVGEPGGWVVGAAAVVEQGAREGVGDQPLTSWIGRPGSAAVSSPQSVSLWGAMSGLRTRRPVSSAVRMSARRTSMERGSSEPRPRASRVSQVNAPAASVAVSSAHSAAIPSASEVITTRRSRRAGLAVPRLGAFGVDGEYGAGQRGSRMTSPRAGSPARGPTSPARTRAAPRLSRAAVPARRRSRLRAASGRNPKRIQKPPARTYVRFYRKIATPVPGYPQAQRTAPRGQRTATLPDRPSSQGS